MSIVLCLLFLFIPGTASMSPAPAPASNGNQCAKDVQLTEQCDCGSHTCNPSVNEGGTHTGTGPDTQCKSATNTCAAPCSQTDGHTEFSTPNFHDDCTCGTATCAGIPNGSDKYCDASTSTCASHAIATDATQGDAAPGTAPASANNDAIATTCASSSLTCQGTSFATPNAMCADDPCIASEFADASSTCCEALAPCTDGAIDLTYTREQNPPASCECGSSICKYGQYNIGENFEQNMHRWCEVASSTCADYPICSNTDASTALVAPDYSTLAGFNGAGSLAQWEPLFCQCGTEKCEFNTNPSPGSHNHLKSKEYCDATSSRCTFAPCGNTDGTASNPVRCQCGMDECDVGQLGVSEPSGGYYCNAANHLCGATKDVNKFSSTVPAVIGPDLYKRRSAPMNYYTKCSSVAGTVAITDFIDCAEAAAAKGARISKLTYSDYPAGCLISKGDEVFFNDMPEQFTKDETTYKMICKAGTLCPNIGGSATNVNKCVCGRKECAPGSTCKSSESLCTLVNQAEKIAEIETNQKTCCSKNAALEAEIALLKKQYEGIDKVCKTTSSEGKRRRLASSGCGGGGASMSNTNTPDGLSPGDIAAIVIVPIVVLLGCVGGCIMYMQQQTEKIEKTPENLYELKNFTPKRVTVELFDVRGSMNSNNPLTERNTLTIPELSIETDSSQSFTGTNPMLRNQ